MAYTPETVTCPACGKKVTETPSGTIPRHQTHDDNGRAYFCHGWPRD